MKLAKFELSIFGINTYVVWDPESREAAIVDPGMINEEEQKAVVDFLERENLKLRHLINTHLHIDHAIGNSFIRTHFGLKTEASPADAFLGERLREQAASFGIPIETEAVSIEVPLKEGDRIELGKEALEVIAVPGHSPGSLVLYDRKEGFLIGGDVLFRSSVGRTDLPGGHTETLLSGIKKKLFSLPDNTVVFPGHGPATTIGEEKRSNPFLR